MYQLVYGLVGKSNELFIPKQTSSADLSEAFNDFFLSKVASIREGLDKPVKDLPVDTNSATGYLFFAAHGECNVMALESCRWNPFKFNQLIGELIT